MFVCFFVVLHWLTEPMSFKITPLALGQSYDCPSAIEAILKDMDKIIVINTLRTKKYNH